LDSLLKIPEGVILILGKVDSGKTTFTLFLVNAFISEGRRVAVVDADPGQADIGPPGTLSLGFPEREIQKLSEILPVRMAFIGSTSPAGIFMWPTVWGVYDLVKFARERREIVIIDSSGLVFGRDGYTLIRSKISLIRPDLVVFLGEEREYIHLIEEASRYSVVKLFPSSPSVKRKSFEERKANRIRRWKNYFTGSFEAELYWDSLKIGGFPHFGVGIPFPRERLRELSLELGTTILWAEEYNGMLKCLTFSCPKGDFEVNLDWLSLESLKHTLVGLEGREGLIDVGLVLSADGNGVLIKTRCVRLNEVERVLLSKLKVDEEVFRD